jgi:hypothetical protein
LKEYTPYPCQGEQVVHGSGLRGLSQIHISKTKLQNQLTKNGHNFSKKCFKNGGFQKMSITKNVPLN